MFFFLNLERIKSWSNFLSYKKEEIGALRKTGPLAYKSHLSNSAVTEMSKTRIYVLFLKKKKRKEKYVKKADLVSDRETKDSVRWYELWCGSGSQKYCFKCCCCVVRLGWGQEGVNFLYRDLAYILPINSCLYFWWMCVSVNAYVCSWILKKLSWVLEA